MTLPNSNVVPLCQIGAKSAATTLAANGELSLQEKVMVYQNISRFWRRFLTSVQLSLMLYIVDRSVGWGKVSFTAFTDNVLYGDDNYAGVELSRRTYFRTLKELEDMDLIRRTLEGRKTRIFVNVKWRLDVKV